MYKYVVKPRLLRNSHVSVRARRIQRLSQPSVTSFRKEIWDAGQPAFLPKETISSLPAIKEWFHKTHDDYTLNEDYLGVFGDTLLPIEYTQREMQDRVSDESFHRGTAPLDLFLAWARIATDTSTQRLYIAQADVSQLPLKLQRDLPAPTYVTGTGRGDIYASNLWMGIAPTNTPLHRDPNPNIFVQIAGRKNIRLFAPLPGQQILELARVQAQCMLAAKSSAIRGDEMMVGPEKDALDRLVWGMNEADHDVTLQPGEAMFIPQGWWHSIRGIGRGVTASVNWWFR